VGQTKKEERKMGGKMPNEECCDLLLYTISFSGDPVKTNDMVGACVTYGGGEKAYGFSDGEPEGNRPFGRRGH
jgi:hypothetical protein